MADADPQMMETTRVASNAGTGAIWPVLLSGGAGTRLWPLSRADMPKQLLPLVSAETMLQATARRSLRADGWRRPVVVANARHRHLIADQLQSIDQRPESIILEPAGRNTAAAIALAAHRVLADDADGIMLVMPSDHVIENVAAFRDAVTAATPAARSGLMVAFGVRPTSPATGYGYIRAGDPLGTGPVRRIERFVEKPDRATAEVYVADGGYSWNAGIFLFGAAAFLRELELHAPEIATACAAAMRDPVRDGVAVKPDSEAFARSPSISVDYAVMEKTERAAVMAVDMGWSDVGSWEALLEVAATDDAGNATDGPVTLYDSKNTLVRNTSGAHIAVVGLDGYVVAASPDAMLVAPLSRAQDIKGLVQRLEAEGNPIATKHSGDRRPWGRYRAIDNGDGYQVKQIVVKPGGLLSLQKHAHRAEHWIVVQGLARVTVDDRVLELRGGEHVYIPKTAVHRLENIGTRELFLIEVQCGDYLGEDDIVRLEDVYGRS